ncbi:hypothetical protein H9Y04_36395 [Streptomyces sp. TRM66268-LWL]|uniref:SH3 domain-containing protein n=1 Tax=Streptomyces polyasparticus TaxID=2767826 RepID=A0ABR7SUS4_9ACTN|nr:hypothetical protein [Streptomyces polyasparticus]MBC9718028.1 hypothetical protein [Streptomyces polyasparticus]
MTRRVHIALSMATMIGLCALPSAAHADTGALATPAAARAVRAATCTVVVDAAVVRAKPRTTSTALAIAHLGDRCRVHGRTDGRWIKGTFHDLDVTGYVRADLVSLGREDLQDTGE